MGTVPDIPLSGLVCTGPPDWRAHKNRLTGRCPAKERCYTLGECCARLRIGVKDDQRRRTCITAPWLLGSSLTDFQCIPATLAAVQVVQVVQPRQGHRSYPWRGFFFVPVYRAAACMAERTGVIFSSRNYAPPISPRWRTAPLARLFICPGLSGPVPPKHEAAVDGVAVQPGPGRTRPPGPVRLPSEC